MGDEADVMPGTQLPDLGLTVAPHADEGPVLVQIEYRIAAEQRPAFLHAIHGMEDVRRRNGAFDWRVFRDLEEEDLFVERYIVDSWAEYQRLRSRATVADRDAHKRIADLQQPGIPVRISRFIGLDPRDVRDSVRGEPT
jgi:hypothetical protein